VAIIDDDASVRRALSRILLSVGIPARSFGSAEEYLARARDPEPRCILLDVQLGRGLNGFQLKERLEAGGAAPPIILMTGQADVPLPGAGECGEVNALRKPFPAERLIECVRRHLEPAASHHPTLSY
jgi:FixJ family two-component response regulator